MLLKEYRTYFLEQLDSLYGAIEAESLFGIALGELKGWKRIDLAMHPDAQLSREEIERWNAVLEQLQLQKPIQYIFGKAHFYGLDFEVNSNTLIPRPETEELVQWIITDNEHKGKIKILDIGTGSGCIAIALAKNMPDVSVTALDISAEALAVAKRNAGSNGVEIDFIQNDILEAESLPGTYDVIVSNPPYVRHLEKEEIKDNVLQYEPHLALFVEDNDALLFYRKIALLAKNHLTAYGKLYFEINQYLGPETTEMLESYGYKQVALRKDIYGNDRMIAASL